MAKASLTQQVEVVRMAAAMLCGGENVVGCMTTGGSESIMMASKYTFFSLLRLPGTTLGWTGLGLG